MKGATLTRADLCEAVHTEAFVSGRDKQTRRERAHAIALAAAEAGVAGYTIGVRDEETTFGCPPGQTVLDAANAARVPFPQSCGEGACGTCRVQVLAGPYETDTRGMFSAGELDDGWRLACQTLPTGDLTIGGLTPSSASGGPVRTATSRRA